MESSETSTPPTKRKRINRMDLAYMAGIFDGEGCICAQWNKAGGKRYMTLRVDVTNTHRGMLEWIKARFGGEIYDSCVPTGHKDKWTWRCAAVDLKWFLKLMIPLTIIKQRRARLALIFRHLTLVKASDEKKRRIFDEIRRLNA